MSNPSQKTALVVDDDPDIRKIVTTYLMRLGFAVQQVGNGRDAISRLEEVRPSLLCIDLVLPESSGYDVCEHVSRSEGLRGLPILMMSARTMPGDRAMAEELGVREYLVKPFTQAEFVAHVTRAIAGTRA